MRSNGQEVDPDPGRSAVSILNKEGKMRRRDLQVQVEEKVLDVNASMQGSLRFDDPVNLRINGKFEGTLNTKGTLVIGKGAEIRANISGESIAIEGLVHGNIKATKSLKLGATARLAGDVETLKLVVEDGAEMNGKIQMSGRVSSDGIGGTRGDWMTLDQLAKYLEVERQKVNEWVNNDLLPGTREGGEWVFEKAKVDQWIAEGRVRA